MGTVRILNTSYQSFSLRQNTRLVTSDGIYFTMPEAVEIPPGTRKGPSEITVPVTAMEKDEAGNIIGARGNVPVGTQLLIRNLPASYTSKLVYAIATDNFSG